jgi:hypothetical protein
VRYSARLLACGVLLAAVLPVQVASAYVTSDTAGSHVAVPGTPMFGLDHDGVAEVIITVPSGPGAGQYRGTGTLLSGGQSLLIAAHLIYPVAVFAPGTSITATWQLSGGPVSATSTTFAVGPLFIPGNEAAGGDIAVVTFGSPVNPLVPRYDIYRGTNDVGLGVQSIKVGYGQSGIGSTGRTLPSGTKRVGLNSYDMDANALLSAYGAIGPLPAAGVASVYDFDSGSGSPLNDTLSYPPTSLPPHTGFGADEVCEALGDSGGPTFLAANDTHLSLSSGGSLGTVIVNSGALNTTVTVSRTGDNSTTYGVAYGGDATNGNTTGSFSGTLPDQKIIGVTSWEIGPGASPPDATPTIGDSSWGELGFDTRVAYYQAFLSPFVTEPGTADSQTQSLHIGDATAGSKTATITIDNLATSFEVAGTGSSDANDVATFTATVLDRSNASFSGSLDENTYLLDFGTVPQGSSPLPLDFYIHDLMATLGFTAGLDLDSIAGSGDTGVLTTNLNSFPQNLTAGAFLSFLAYLDATNPGSFEAIYTISVSDEDLPGAASGPSLILTLRGEVRQENQEGTIPEPCSLALLAAGLVALARRRR